MNKTKPYQYSWCYNNNFQVLVDGSSYFPSMLAAIKNAQHFILLEAYLFESGEIATSFIAELIAAKKRQVKIYVLLDEYGTKGLNEYDKSLLTRSGIELTLYNPTSLLHFGKSLKRDHRKLLVADNNIAFIGGAGIADEFSQKTNNEYWHDVMLKIKGDVINDLIFSFNAIWKIQNTDIKPPHLKNKIRKNKTTSKSRLLISKGSEKNEILRSTINHIRSSKQRVWLTSPYFISSRKIRRALRYAAKKGVDVRLIFPGPDSDHKWVTYGIQRYYQRLLRANVSVYEFQPRFTHAKIILCDDWYTLGSSNLDVWNQFLNLDLNIEIYDEKSHQEIVALFNSDFSNSHQIELQQWKTRSLKQHFKEWLSGRIIRWLAIISRKFKR